MKILLFFIAIILFTSCTSTKKASVSKKTQRIGFQISSISTDKTYGYTKENPIKVGGSYSNGPENEQKFLDLLRGPNGEELEYNRTGSCCQFDSDNAPFGSGVLDVYEVWWRGLEKPIVIYLNMYDTEEMFAPVGFTIKK